MKKKFLWISFTGLLFIILLSPFFIANIFLPQEISIIKGKEHFFEFNLPIEAKILKNDFSSLIVNNETVKDEINIDLAEAFSVKSEQTGSLDVNLKLFGVIPLKTITVDVMPDIYVVPCGNTIGVRIYTDGVMVLGTGQVNAENGASEPAKGVVKAGDLILEANDTQLNSKEELIKEINGSKGEKIHLKINRQGEIIETDILPVVSMADKSYKIGVWVRDSTQGIGTMTYYNLQTKKFGALGHGIQDVDTAQLMSVKEGDITTSEINSIKKGKKGVPGELVGSIIADEVLGEVKLNTPYGVYGVLDDEKNLPKEAISIGLKQEVHEGPATIYSSIIDGEVREYDIYIQSINHYSIDDAKGMIIKITDKKLIENTGGIVQGMSGSPIIQDGKLIGAVTHVFVQDPTKGYGIFIESMLQAEESIK